MAHGNRLSPFLPVLTFHETYYPNHLPTSPSTLGNKKNGLMQYERGVFRHLFPAQPARRGAALVIQPGTTRIHNRGSMYRTFPYIYDIPNIVCRHPVCTLKWSGAACRTPIKERAKLHVSIMVLQYAEKFIHLLSKGTRVRWSAELF